MRRAVDVLLLAALFTVTFAKLRWNVGPVTVTAAELFACLFIGAFAVLRIRAGDWRFPRTVQVLGVFFALFLLVYLLGYFNLSSVAARNLYVKGTISFGVHFVFLMAAVSHLVRRTTPFLWRAVAWFCAGLAVNALYALLALVYAESTGGQRARRDLHRADHRGGQGAPALRRHRRSQHLPVERPRVGSQPPGDHAARPAPPPSAGVPQASKQEPSPAPARRPARPVSGRRPRDPLAQRSPRARGRARRARRPVPAAARLRAVPRPPGGSGGPA